jgi:Domain of Unknown Function (DUF930)
MPHRHLTGLGWSMRQAASAPGRLMSRLFLGTACFFLTQTVCYATGSQMDSRFLASLKRLDPETRQDQVCDYEAMLRLGRELHGFHPDRAKAEVISKPIRTSHSVKAAGGAFRSAGHWYVLAYDCETSSDQMKVTSFSYQVGKLIPPSDWPKYGLWQ